MSDDAAKNEVRINRGLKGVYFERSGVSDIDGSKGELSYRGYSIHDLAANATFEETALTTIPRATREIFVPLATRGP